MRINGTDTDAEKDVLEIADKKKDRSKKVKIQKREKNTGIHPAEKGSIKVSDLLSFGFGGLAVVALIITIVFGVFTIGSWWNVRSTNREITENYSEDIINGKVYVAIEVITATVDGYKDGVINTDYGKISGNNPNSSVVLVYYALDGSLKLLSDIYNGNNYVEYVTDNFVPADPDAIVLKSAADKGSYQDYINDTTELVALQDKKESNASVLKISAILTILAAVLFLLGRAGLFDKLDNKKENNPKESGNELNIAPDNTGGDEVIVDANVETPDKPKDVRKPPIKTDVDPGE